MSASCIRVLIIVLLSAMTPQVQATAYWFVHSTTGAYLAGGTVNGTDNVNIDLTGLGGMPGRIWVLAGSASEDIGRVYISGTVSSAQTVYLHVDNLSTPPTSMYSSTADAAGRDWGGVSNSYNAAVIVSACVTGNLTAGFSSGGGASTVYIDYLYFGGAIQNGFSGKAGEFWVRAASVASGAHITCDTGDLTSLTVASGSLLANVTSTAGKIGTISVSGDIGSTSSTVTINSATGIDAISGANVYANINPTTATPVTGTLTSLTTTGDLGGVARTHGFNTMSIGGSLIGSLALKGANPFPSGKTITIGHSLASTGDITVATGSDLGGQVIINKNNSGGTWASGGEVIANPSGSSPITLTGPTYPTLSSELGGGAIGLAGFNLHVQDSEPPEFLNSVGETMRLRHYGPVTWGSGAVPLKIEYWQYNSEFGWIDITEDFDIYPGPTGRDIIIETLTALDFDVELQYRITPIRTGTHMLKCVGVGNGSVPVADYSSWIVGP